MSQTRLALVFWLLALTAHADDRALPRTDQRYEIDVTLDPASHTLVGSERISFVNHSQRPLRELYFHLYLNAFRDHHSVFMREGGTQLRDARLQQPGHIEITALHTQAGADLLPSAQAELVPGDRTQLRVPLPAPLSPRATLVVQVAFRAQLPALLARSGYAGEFHMVAQWFPKLARLDETSGWTSFPYHGLGEFYADFADYRVRITLPARFVVGSSGALTNTEVHGTLRTDELSASAVHDFAFAAYPYFERVEQRVQGVQVRVLAPRGYAAAAQRQLRVVRAGLLSLGARFGRYPYATLTVIIPPRDADAAAGMEYPTLFVSGGPWWALPAALPDPAQDFVTAHELAHQWFCGMIASNEVAYPMLDEGLAQWATLLQLRELYGSPPSLFAGRALPIDPFDVTRAVYLRRADPVPSSLLAVDAYRFETLARAVYLRPALVLDALATIHGEERVQRALSNYAHAQRFRHPTPVDLFASFDDVYGPGYSEQQLRPALSGTPTATLEPTRAAAAHAPTERSFFAEALLLAQTLLQGLGP